MARTQDTWPAGATWVFQGTVLEDATVGTHLSSLTVTPGAGNELLVLYGRIVVGNTATAQVVSIFIDDGTNLLVRPLFVSNTTASVEYQIGYEETATTINPSANVDRISLDRPFIVSGTMRLVLQVSTTIVSLTQTFAIACRIKSSALPTATLADTVGVPTLTTNTNQVF